VKVAGVYSVPAVQERAYALLQDPGVLARCMPGCERMDRLTENEYAMQLKMVLASIKGLFEGKVRVAEPNPPESFRLILEGAGKIGFMRGDGLLRLSRAEAGTVVQFEGDVQVGGTIASVGQRLLDTTARMLIKRFFDRFTSEVSAGEGPEQLRQAAD
jgi:carbon monoxide dehydrogenase subunit G